MKKIILSAVVAAAALFGAYTAQQASEVAMSNLQVENLEMLAEGEPAYGFGFDEDWSQYEEVTVTYSNGTSECKREYDITCHPGNTYCVPCKKLV